MERAAGQGRGHGFYRRAGLRRVARILPVQKLRAKFEIATMSISAALPVTYGVPSLLSIWPRRVSFDRGGFGKIAKIYGWTNSRQLVCSGSGEQGHARMRNDNYITGKLE